jgi:hypothetical protein
VCCARDVLAARRRQHSCTPHQCCTRHTLLLHTPPHPHHTPITHPSHVTTRHRDLANGGSLGQFRGNACGRNRLCRVGRDYVAAVQSSKDVIHFWTWNRVRARVRACVWCCGRGTPCAAAAVHAHAHACTRSDTRGSGRVCVYVCVYVCVCAACVQRVCSVCMMLPSMARLRSAAAAPLPALRIGIPCHTTHAAVSGTLAPLVAHADSAPPHEGSRLLISSTFRACARVCVRVSTHA